MFGSDKKTETMNMIKARVESLEEHRAVCDRQHIEHTEHRLRLYDKLDEAIAYLRKISVAIEFIEQNKETIIRTHDGYIRRMRVLR